MNDMDVAALRAIPTATLLFNVVLYGCLPLWLIMGMADWVCHKRSKIEETSGLKESLLHTLMGVQIGIPIFLGLFFDINVLLLLVIFSTLVAHEYVAHHDVKYALNKRTISIAETHVHSFLEVIPFVIVILIVCINWNSFVDLITLDWKGHMGLVLKAHPLDKGYIAGYVALMLFADVIPFYEEFIRCWRNRDKIPQAAKQVTP